MIDSDMIYAFMQDNAVAEITKSQKNVSGDNVSCAQATDRCLDLFFILSEYIQKKVLSLLEKAFYFRKIFCSADDKPEFSQKYPSLKKGICLGSCATTKKPQIPFTKKNKGRIGGCLHTRKYDGVSADTKSSHVQETQTDKALQIENCHSLKISYASLWIFQDHLELTENCNA